MDISSVVLIGSGNIATHLAKAFDQAGIRILQVFSRNINNASLLAGRYGSTVTDKPLDILPDAGLYVSCLTDDITKAVLKQFRFNQQFVVHTSGFLGMEELEGISGNYGVFYPLQTFLKNIDLNFSEIPVFVEANTIEGSEQLMNLASLITENPYYINSDTRRMLHLAAVFANNFSNLMYCIAEELAIHKKIDFEVLKPLILQTAINAIRNTPGEVQTGPGKRKDMGTIETQFNLLSDFPSLQNIYKILTDEIIKRQQQ